jgi:hypothetical protein
MADIPNPFDFSDRPILTLFAATAQNLREIRALPAGRDRNRGSRVALEIWNARKGLAMHANIVVLQPLVALIFGILILILPRLLNYLIAIYLILVGLTGLFPHLFTSSV